MKKWSLVDKYLKAFKEWLNYTTCRELTSVNVKTPEGIEKYFETIHDYACTERLIFVVEKTLNLLEEK